MLEAECLGESFLADGSYPRTRRQPQYALSPEVGAVLVAMSYWCM
jgi:hypothetical protein